MSFAVPWLLTAVFFALAGEADAMTAYAPAPPPSLSGAEELQWADASARFDLNAAGEASEPVQTPAASATRPRDGFGWGTAEGPWADRKDFSLATLSLFGVALLGFAALVDDKMLSTIGATVLVLGFLLFSAAG